MADKRQKPAKPYPDFPLTTHANGQWCKKIRGKVYFFGVWDDPAAALQKYVEQRDDLQAGRQPRRLSGDELTVGQLCNSFLTAKESRVQTGELEPRTFQGYHKTCENLVRRLGRCRLVEDLRPIDFDKLRIALAKGKSPNSISNEVIRVRMVFKYGYDAALIERPVRFGPNFTKAPKRSVRKAENNRTPRLFTPEQLRSILSSADVPMRAAVHLGLNCAFGASDTHLLSLLGGAVNSSQNGLVSFRLTCVHASKKVCGT